MSHELLTERASNRHYLGQIVRDLAGLERAADSARLRAIPSPQRAPNLVGVLGSGSVHFAACDPRPRVTGKEDQED
jgi:hypothetical protein